MALLSATIYKVGGPGSEIEADETTHASRRAHFKTARESATLVTRRRFGPCVFSNRRERNRRPKKSAAQMFDNEHPSRPFVT
jgi:hypothetical protein